MTLGASQQGSIRAGDSAAAESLQSEVDGREPIPGRQPALGLLPLLLVCMASGLLLIALAGVGARAGDAWAEPLFWLGLSVVALPVFARLVGSAASDQERLWLVMLFSLALYAIKVLHSPAAFTLPDEFIHTHNVAEAVQNHRLFEENSIQPVTSLYPGLASATSALVTLSGLSDFSAGLLMIAAARLILLLAMFLIVERLTRSSRVAGIVALLYTANPNFLFYSAEFGYEQIALPLAALVIYAVDRRGNADEPGRRFGWTALTCVSLMAVVVSHHLTGYGLVAALWAMCLILAVYVKQPALAPWDLAALGLAFVVGWLALVASPTLVYLGQIFGGTATAGLQMLSSGQSGRLLFQSSSGGSVTPLWKQVLGVTSVLLIVLGLPVGCVHVWRRYRRNALALLLGAAALLYPPIQLLRLTPLGWETSTRISEVLFVGVGFVLALLIVHLEPRVRTRRTALAIPLMTLFAAVIFAGGIVTGWRSDLLLPRPYLVSASGPAIEPEGVTVARWTRSALGAETRFAADPSSAFLLLAYGSQRPLTGEARGIRSLFFTRTFDTSVTDILTRAQVRYLAFDRRLISWNLLLGIYPSQPGASAADPDVLLDPDAVSKFDNQPYVSRILDAGNIVIYDVGGLYDAAPAN